MATTENHGMLIVKMTLGKEIRRFTANTATFDWSTIAKRAVEAFELASQKFKMTYVDDEGDQVTLSSDEELSDAVALALSGTPAVLRLTVHQLHKAKEKPQDDLAKCVETIASQLVASQLPDMMRHFLPAGDTFVFPHSYGATQGAHEGVTCDKSGMHPIVGNRYHLDGHNYDLCEAEYQKLDDKEKPKFCKIPPPSSAPMGIHPGVSCDRSGMAPILGMRFHLRGHNYDLCQAEYDKLPDAEKALYDAIPPPVVGATTGVGGWAAAGGSFGPWRGRGGWGRGCAFGKGMGGKGGCGKGGGGMGSGKLGARFICDVSVFDGTQVAPGTTFTKIWRVKNIGEVPWPAGTRILFVGGDQMSHEQSVPIGRDLPVQPGEEVDVAVEMTAPDELGRYLGYWRLAGPHLHRKWGQRLCCHVQAVDPSLPANAVNVDSAVAEFEKMKSSLPAEDGEEEERAGELPSAACATTSATPGGGIRMEGISDKPTETGPAVVTGDGTATEDAVLVTDKMVTDAQPEADTAPEAATGTVPEKLASVAKVKASLKSMGFLDETMIEAVMAKHGDDIDSCATDLAAASEWACLLDDLAEMGFEDRELNKTLMLKNHGNIKRTVKDLIEA